ncbi:hypothetical protein BIV57_08165 [Mangrovactinospora gilvigrisea]|uniref:Protein kinase domain-containing protein n=1 Tax=Mangrovactinospora gilvigrisea TaxID=1428644 RepID=A0A1J7C8X5_9ACTN|nr:serine/threonine-protein kinase [Mangrovactinospora gilvigrisea]OIV37980.1 hypothetical protein BIV57_08165 [Mangrovactinospora gilvigrisea]
MDGLEPDDPAEVGPYRLIARLGAGGMGRVYLARDPRGIPVAVKLVHPRLAEDDGFRGRFRREVDAARAVVGGGRTAAVVNADPEAELPWLATEFVLGPELGGAVLACGPLPEPAVRVLGSGLAAALAEVHRAGLVHRDVKPSNVLLTVHGPRLIDFGIARSADAAGLTQTGQLVGTPPYMSPEQASGRPLSAASDVFSLGSVLVYAATGHGPFDAAFPAAQLNRVIEGEPDLDGVPPNLLPLIRSCLQKEPQRRPDVQQLAGPYGFGAPPSADGWLPGPLAALVTAHADEVLRARTPRHAPAVPGARTASARRGPRPWWRRPVLAAPIAAALVLAAVVVLDIRHPFDHPQPKDGIPVGYHVVHDPLGFTMAIPDGLPKRTVSRKGDTTYVSFGAGGKAPARVVVFSAADAPSQVNYTPYGTMVLVEQGDKKKLARFRERWIRDFFLVNRQGSALAYWYRPKGANHDAYQENVNIAAVDGHSWGFTFRDPGGGTAQVDSDAAVMARTLHIPGAG